MTKYNQNIEPSKMCIILIILISMGYSKYVAGGSSL